MNALKQDDATVIAVTRSLRTVISRMDERKWADGKNQRDERK